MNLKHINIDNELFFQLRCKHEQISEYLINCELDFTDSVGVMGGLAGISLLQSLYYQHIPDERYLDKLHQSIELINDKIKTGQGMMPTYCGGIAGYGWLINYLKENDLIEIDMEDYFAEIDSYLYKHLLLMLETENFDPLHGAVGMGFYFIKRGNVEAIERIIDELYNNRINIGNHYSWIMKDFANKKDVINFGVAHGIPGILLFLYKCYQKNICIQKCREMIKENISFFLKYINLSGTPSFFPYSIDFNEIMQYDRQYNRSRLAWCYGDLGILYVFSHLSKDFPIQMDIYCMLEHVARRRGEGETLVSDAAFCHGTSGIAHLYYRFFLQTGNSCFEETCNYWLKRTLSMGNNPEGTAGFLFPENKNILPLDLLTGISGIGSVLLSFMNPDLIHWDESLFLT